MIPDDPGKSMAGRQAKCRREVFLGRSEELDWIGLDWICHSTHTP
jgi:hypothetical protein